MTHSWTEHALFEGMDAVQLAHIAEHMESRCYEEGDYIVREGEAADTLFVVVSGQLVVTRQTETSVLELRHMGPGELFGEMGRFLDGKRTASVRALGPVELLSFPFEVLVDPGSGLSASAGMHKVGGLLSRRAAQLSDDKVALLSARVKMGAFFVTLVCFLAAYTLGLSLVHTFRDQLGKAVPLISLLMMVMFAAATLWQVHRRGWSLADFGIHRKDLGRSVKEALAISLPILALLTLGKWALIRLHPGYAQVPLIGLSSRLEMYGPWILLALTLSYAVFAPIQEFLVRGVLQTALEEFLDFEARTVWAVLISNLLFAAVHLHVSYLLAGLAFVSGLLWGWMFARHRTLVGVSISHLIIGLYAIYVLASQPI